MPRLLKLCGICVFVFLLATQTVFGQLFKQNQNSGGGNRQQGWGQGNQQQGWGQNNRAQGWGRNGSRPENYPRHNGNHNDGDEEYGWDDAIRDLGKALENVEPQQPQYPNGRPPRPQYPRPQYPRPYPRPQYPDYYREPRPQYVEPRPVPPPKRKVAKVKPNPPPPAPLAKLVKNASPLTAAAFPRSMHGLLSQSIQNEQDKRLGEIDTLMSGAPPAVMNDPDVIRERQEIQDKVDKGEPITEKDKQEYIDAIKAANGGNIPPGVEKDLNDRLDSVQELGEVREELENLNSGGGGGGGGGGLPGGVTQIIYNPSLPDGVVYTLPNGDLMVGTGGQGSMTLEEGSLAEAMGLPVGIGEPAPETETDMADRITSGVLLLNPAENDVAMSYLINNRDYSMEAGYTQTLASGKNWTIRFSRGPGRGEAKYSLSRGTYYFGTSARGWELFQKSYSVTIDNSENSNAFQYVVNNKNGSVAAGESATHNSDYPILVKFDRGAKGEPSTKKITEKQVTLRVAVNPDDNLWDLYPERNVRVADDEPTEILGDIAQWPAQPTPDTP